MNWIEKLERYSPCSEAVDYCRNYTSAQKAWDSCERGDWMLWLLGKLSGESESQSRRKLVLTACKCARLSLKFVSKDEKRPLKAIQTAEAWAKRKEGVTLDDVKDATVAASALCGAETKILKKCADIVRKDYPKAPRLR